MQASLQWQVSRCLVPLLLPAAHQAQSLLLEVPRELKWKISADLHSYTSLLNQLYQRFVVCVIELNKSIQADFTSMLAGVGIGGALYVAGSISAHPI